MKNILFCIFIFISISAIAKKPGDKVLAIYIDEFGHQWIGTDNGLLVRFGNTAKAYKVNPGSPGIVTDIVSQDANGTPVIWIGTENGTGRIKYNSEGITAFSFFSKDTTKFNSEIINAIDFDNKNSGFFVTPVGVGIFSNNIWEYRTDFFDIYENKFTSVRAKGDTIYFGTEGEGVGRMVSSVDGYTGASSLVRPWSPIVNDTINYIFFDSKGNQWYGTNKGLSRHSKLDAKEGWDFSLTDQLQNKYITCIAEDKSGNLWIGTRGGLVLLSSSLEIKKTFTVNDGLPSDNVCTVCVYDESVLVGTEMGLAHLQGMEISITKTSDYTKDFIDLTKLK